MSKIFAALMLLACAAVGFTTADAVGNSTDPPPVTVEFTESPAIPPEIYALMAGAKAGRIGEAYLLAERGCGILKNALNSCYSNKWRSTTAGKCQVSGKMSGQNRFQLRVDNRGCEYVKIHVYVFDSDRDYGGGGHHTDRGDIYSKTVSRPICYVWVEIWDSGTYEAKPGKHTANARHVGEYNRLYMRPGVWDKGNV